jgi:hypothetical protein
MIGFDADQDCSSVAAAAAAKGVKFICRYTKNVTIAEIRALHGAGIAVVPIWETTAERALAGSGAGTVDGTQARLAARKLGAPSGTAIYATVDFGETADQNADVLAYLAAFERAIAPEFKLGVYGEGAVCQAALGASIADFTWLAGGGRMRGTQAFLQTGLATIVQDVGDRRSLDLGIEIDSDVAIDGDIGEWKP